MSKVSYCLIALIVAALLFMGAVRVREWYTQRQEEKEMASQNDGNPFTFQQVPVSLAAPEIEAVQTPVKYKRAFPEIYLEDAPLTTEQQVQQAQETIASIVEDFQSDPAVAQFNQEVAEASQGELNGLVDLSTQNLQQILKQNPEVARIVEKHAQNADFAKALQEIFENPQFQQSVKELQGESPLMQKQPAQ